MRSRAGRLGGARELGDEGAACHGVRGFRGREVTGVGSGGPEGTAGAGGDWRNVGPLLRWTCGRDAPEAF